MQKKLLTIAVAGALAAPVLAQAQQASGTEVYGTVNMSFGQFKYGAGTAANNADGVAPATAAGAAFPGVSKMDVNSGGSNFGVRSRESLGGGLAGWVQIETGTSMERANDASVSPGSRNTAVGMQGGFGNVFIGQWTTPWADLDALWSVGTVYTSGPVTAIIGRRETTGTAPNPNATNNVNGQAVTNGAANQSSNATEGAGGVGHPFWRRFSQALFYQSPVMAGVQVKLAYQTNESKAVGNVSTNADPSAWSGSVQWAGMGGRARIGLGYDKHKDFTSIGASDSGYTVKGGWNFGVIDVGFAYEKNTYKCLGNQPGATAGTNVTGQPGLCASDGDIRAKQYAVAIAVPVGPGSIRASYAVAKDLEGPVTSVAGTGVATTHMSDTGAKQYNIGYEHRFSKRTNVGIGYAKIDNKANANFTWSGSPPNQGGNSLTPVFGSDVSTFFVSMTHRF
jgi:predicted porin